MCDGELQGLDLGELEGPRLFGIKNSNRDFSVRSTWGKNQFNSSFPASLTCYLASKEIDPLYLRMNGGVFNVGTLSVERIFGSKYDAKSLFFSFESPYIPFQQYVVGTLPRTDLVTLNTESGKCLSGLEVKLTAIPDQTTCMLSDEEYGSEIVVRPDTIVYLACSIIHGLKLNLGTSLSKLEIKDWTDPLEMLSHKEAIIQNLNSISKLMDSCQSPFLLQPIWKTEGKSPVLADNCLDVFVWSDAGMLNFIADISSGSNSVITRQYRTAVWVYKMLYDYVDSGRFNYKVIIDNLTYNLKNDKSFSSSGAVTYPYMKCERLTNPAIKKEDIKHIILGDGQNLLSPERRFDAIICNSTDLFEK